MTATVPDQELAGAVPAYYTPALPPTVAVVTPVGHEMSVLEQSEADYYNGQSREYQHQFAFTNVADLADLSRLLFFELQVYRLSGWLSTGKDNLGMDVDTASTRRAVKEFSDQISKVKGDLGMTKSQRDKEREQSSAQYIRNLQIRAKEFGVHRENQLRVALELMNDLSAIIGPFDRSDAVERERLGFADEKEIVAWVRDVMLPKYQEVDNHFRQNHQKFWLQEV